MASAFVAGIGSGGNKRYFENKRCIVTGASSGIGRNTAEWLIKHGAKVAICGRNIEALHEIERMQPDKVLAIEADFAVDREQYQMVLSGIEFLGGLDILINAAGCVFENDLEKTYPQDHDYIIDINLRAVYHITQLCMVFLAKTHGCIVNISGEWGSKPFQGCISYCMSKAGLEMLTKCLALELGKQGVRVNAVSPGATRSNFMGAAGLPPKDQEAFYHRLGMKNPMKRVGEVQDITNAILFLCSPAASQITGVILPVDGGHSLTSTLHSDWQGTEHMNARFAPTGLGAIPKFTNWLENEIVGKIWGGSSNPPAAQPIQGVNWEMDRETEDALKKALH